MALRFIHIKDLSVNNFLLLDNEFIMNGIHFYNTWFGRSHTKVVRAIISNNSHLLKTKYPKVLIY